MSRPGPRRVLLGVKVLPDTIERLDALTVAAGAESRSDVARVGVELVAAGLVTRRPGLCRVHDGGREDAMYVVELPGGGDRWFCETTQQFTRGEAQP